MNNYQKYKKFGYQYKDYLIDSFGCNRAFNGERIYTNMSRSYASVNSVREFMNRFYRINIFKSLDLKDDNNYYFQLVYVSFELFEKSKFIVKPFQHLYQVVIYLRTFNPLKFPKEYYEHNYLDMPNIKYFYRLKAYWHIFVNQVELFLKNYVPEVSDN